MSWYSHGLRFSCTGCGACCSGAPGFTWVDDEEVLALAGVLGLDEAAFRRRYTRRVHRDGQVLTSLVEHPGGNCAFFRRGQGCAVYAQRPRQCRTWPFWRRIIVSPEAWNEEAQGCPGMDHGALHDAGTIASTAENDGLRW